MCSGNLLIALNAQLTTAKIYYLHYCSIEWGGKTTSDDDRLVNLWLGGTFTKKMSFALQYFESQRKKISLG